MKRVAKLTMTILGSAVLTTACAEPPATDSPPDPAEPSSTEFHEPNHDELGEVAFQVTCADAVRHDFDRAVALVHHMMYQEARSAFQEISEADPECAMAQ